DTDGDGVNDGCDICPGFDDTVDADADGVPDGCDPCPTDNPDDTDGDGVCDSADICPGGDDSVDTDADGVPDFCDICPGFDDTLDADADGVPDGCDPCPNRRPGDVSGDGLVDIGDVPSFVAVLLDPGAASADDFCAADTDEDGDVTGLDTRLFVALILAP
ncbi:MAG: hypothetical protein O7D94_13255, partial [Planctomycetota bacterium]|nr:hypothetical protein [Planctomycetota bacterium]